MTRDEYFAELRTAADKLKTADARVAAHARITELIAMEERLGPTVAPPPRSPQRSIKEAMHELEALSADVAQKRALIEKGLLRRRRNLKKEFMLGVIYLLVIFVLTVIILRWPGGS